MGNRLFGLLFCGAISAACASAPMVPDFLLDPVASPPPDCPADRFLFAAASSPNGRDDAEARARAGVVRQIASAIQVETERVVNVSRKDGVVSADRSLREKISEQASYRHASLIDVVAAQESSGKAYALACLERARAVEASTRDLTLPLSRFDDASARALAAWEQTDRPGFAQGFREARKAAEPLLQLFVEVGAVAGGPSAAEAGFHENLRRIHAAAARLRSEANVVIDQAHSDLPEDVRNTVTDTLRTAVVSLGLRASVKNQTSCDTLPEGSYLLRVESDGGCRWGTLGHTCAPRVELDATDCASSRKVFRAELGGMGKASNARDAQRALRAAFGGLKAESIAPQIARLLEAEIPVSAEP